MYIYIYVYTYACVYIYIYVCMCILIGQRKGRQSPLMTLQGSPRGDGECKLSGGAPHREAPAPLHTDVAYTAQLRTTAQLWRDPPKPKNNKKQKQKTYI